MPVTLTQQQLDDLQTTLTNDDVEEFYSLLISYGDTYGALGLTVTRNDTWQGILANGFASGGALNDSVDLTYQSNAWISLNKNIAEEYLQAYKDNSGETPIWSQVQELHNDAYIEAGLDPDDWLPNKILNDSNDPAALWNDFMINEGASDLWDDAWVIAESGAGLLFGPWLYYQALGNPNGIDTAELNFAKNFLNALAQMEGADIADMADALGIPDLADLVGNIPAAVNGLIDKIPALPDNPFSIPDKAIPDWLPPVLNALPTAAGQSSPLVLDLDGNGIELAALNGTGSVYWNIDNDNFAEASGWIKDGDGLLCIDLNADGIINNHSELFGNTSTYANGFAALDAYDTSNDNYITSADTQFGNLRVWVDTNADGYSQATELHTLSSLGITSIATTYSNVNYSIAGNQILQQSTFTISGNTRTIVDAWFAYDNVNSTYTAEFELDVRTLFMPSLRGYGNLPDLHIAMSQDETLLDMVSEIATEDAATLMSAAFDIQGKIEEIMYRWAGVDSVSPTSRGTYMDARQLEFLEELSGKEWYSNVTSSSNPGLNQAETLIDAFATVFDNYFARLLVQIGVVDIFPEGTNYNLATDEINDYDVPHFVFGTSGVDNFFGTGESNVYILRVGSGIDSINESAAAELDQIWITGGITASDLRMWVDGSEDLHIRIAGNVNDGLKVSGQGAFTDVASRLEQIILDNGTVIDLTQGLPLTDTDDNHSVYGSDLADTIDGRGGDDTLYGGSGNDQLYGGSGSDNLFGSLGNDTYVFAAGYGVDVVNENVSEGTDTVLVTGGVTAGDLRMWVDGSEDLHIRIAGNSTDELRVNGSGAVTDITNRIEQLLFDNNTTIDLTQGLSMIDIDDGHYNYGSNLNDSINGRGGDDNILGYDGNDYLYGGAGADSLFGGAGADIFIFESASVFSASDSIGDFSLIQNDKIDISDVLDGFYNPLTETITDFIQITTSGSNSIVKVDQNGLDGGVNFVQIAQITGVTGLTDEQALVNSGNLIVV